MVDLAPGPAITGYELAGVVIEQGRRHTYGQPDAWGGLWPGYRNHAEPGCGSRL